MSYGNMDVKRYLSFILGIFGFISLITGIQKLQSVADLSSGILLVLGLISIGAAYYISR